MYGRVIWFVREGKKEKGADIISSGRVVAKRMGRALNRLKISLFVRLINLNFYLEYFNRKKIEIE